MLHHGCRLTIHLFCSLWLFINGKFLYCGDYRILYVFIKCDYSEIGSIKCMYQPGTQLGVYFAFYWHMKIAGLKEITSSTNCSIWNVTCGWVLLQKVHFAFPVNPCHNMKILHIMLKYLIPETFCPHRGFIHLSMLIACADSCFMYSQPNC